MPSGLLQCTCGGITARTTVAPSGLIQNGSDHSKARMSYLPLGFGQSRRRHSATAMTLAPSGCWGDFGTIQFGLKQVVRPERHRRNLVWEKVDVTAV